MKGNDEQIIYDIGCNNGDDLPYYLLKAEKVVAVEANPALCEDINQKYRDAILDHRLIVENCVFLADDHEKVDVVDFYIHREKHVLSQFPKPDANLIAEYEKVVIPAKTMGDLFLEHGYPYYLKIDVEHYDEEILRSMYSTGELPPYLSAEIHSSKVAESLFSRDEYTGFKLVVGGRVAEDYKNASVSTKSGTTNYSFPAHSAGPFGDDIRGPWLDRKSIKRLIVKENGYGWKDLHASQIHVGEKITSPTLYKDYARYYKGKLSPYIPENLKGAYRNIRR